MGAIVSTRSTWVYTGRPCLKTAKFQTKERTKCFSMPWSKATNTRAPTLASVSQCLLCLEYSSISSGHRYRQLNILTATGYLVSVRKVGIVGSYQLQGFN